MILLVARPNWNKHPDRCITFAHTAEWLDEVYLITSEPIPEPLRTRLHPNCSLLALKQPALGMHFSFAAAALAREIVNTKPKGTNLVVHDLAIARLIQMAKVERWAGPYRLRCFLSLYTPSSYLLRTRGWRTQTRQRLRLREEFVHAKVAFSRVVFEYLSCLWADYVTGNSDQIREEVMSVYGRRNDRVFTVPTSVDANFFSPGTHGSCEELSVLFVGRMYARKGLYDLLLAAKILFERGLVFRLRLVGENDVEHQRVMMAIDSSGISDHIELIPPQSREAIRELMVHASLLVLPSYGEGSPRIVKEAMSVTCPVVATCLPGTSMLDPGQEALSLVPVGDVEQLANCLETLLRDPELRRQKGKTGRKLVLENFTPERIASRMVRLYELAFRNGNV